MIDKVSFYNFIIPLYLLLALIGFPYFQYLISSDGICYISIAEKYLSGNYNQAINGFWSPLLSWLLIPFIKLGINPLQAGRVITIGFGLGVLSCLNHILKRITENNLLIMGGLLSVLPGVLFVGLAGNYPDLILLFFTYLLYIITTNPTVFTYKTAIILGMIAGLGFLSKAYFLGFFFLWMPIVFVIQILQNKITLSILLKFYSLSIFVFFLISLPWIVQISTKYERPLISTAGSYNHALKKYVRTHKHPLQFGGLQTPPNETAINISEDKSIVILPKWSPFSSTENFYFLAKSTIKNFFLVFLELLKNNLVAWCILVGALFYFYEKKYLQEIFKSELFWMLLFSMTYISGYLFLIVSPRYIMTFIFLLPPMGIYLICKLDKRFNLTHQKLVILSMILIIGASLPYFKNTVNSLNANKDIHTKAQKVKPLSIPVHSNIASDNDWFKTFYLCYHLDLQYYGMVEGFYKDEITIQKALVDKNIDYFFVNKHSREYTFLTNYKEISRGSIPGIQIYKLR